MGFEMYVCDGCQIILNEYQDWEYCDSCEARYCPDCHDNYDEPAIFRWDHKEQCHKCTNLRSKLSVVDSDILSWFATKHGVNVDEVKKDYEQAMLKSGKIIDDSICGQCKEKCQELWDIRDDRFEVGVCCLCLCFKHEKGCDDCKKRQPAKETLPKVSTSTSQVIPTISSEQEPI